MKLILTRHGETEFNIKGIMQGHLPGKLTVNGIDQAKKLALRLNDKKIDAIYSSDLARAADTAKIIAKYHSNTPLKFVKELREFDLGKFTGKHFLMKKFSISSAKHIESLEQGQKRLKKLLDKVYDKYKDKTVLFVAHNGIGMALVLLLFGNDKKKIRKIKRLSNTSLSVFNIKEDNNHEIHLLNCTDHL